MRFYLLILLAVISSCQKRDDQRSLPEPSPQLVAIVGTWKSDPVEEGRRKKFIVMTFTDDGRVIDYSVQYTDSKSGKISETTPIEGAYRISDGFIHWTIDGSESEIPYRIEGATMRLTLGREDYTFQKQTEAQD